MAGEGKGRLGEVGSIGGGICTLKDTDGSWEVVHTSGSTEGGYYDGGSWDQVVGEGVVKIALEGGLASECRFPPREGGGGEGGGEGSKVPEARTRRSRHQIPSHTYEDGY